jgi:hypothetical protein
VILDHIQNISVSEEQFNTSVHTLRTLKAGLHKIYCDVRLLEQKVLDHHRKTSSYTFVTQVGFQITGLTDQETHIFPNYFPWYGVSVCNYARLCGLIGAELQGTIGEGDIGNPLKANHINSVCSKYVSSIPELEAVKIWRNKVYAHFAATSPKADDDAQLLNLSTVSLLGFNKDRLAVGILAFGTQDGEVNLPYWSVTENFEAIGERFWPELI